MKMTYKDVILIGIIERYITCLLSVYYKHDTRSILRVLCRILRVLYKQKIAYTLNLG